MANVDPEDLFRQAAGLIAAESGLPRQSDLCRAISATYYAIFHFLYRSIADRIVGADRASHTLYALVYRSLDHRSVRRLCDAIRAKAAGRYEPYFSDEAFGTSLKSFAVTFSDIQDRRHRADYDPSPRFAATDARVTLDAAREAISAFLLAPEAAREVFLTLLLCPPR